VTETAGAESAPAQPERDPVLEWVPPGHFYSPIPGREDRERVIAKRGEFPSAIPGVDLNTDVQMELVRRLARWYPEVPFSDNQGDRYRYFFANPNYSYADAIFYFCMLLELKPSRVIEVGSGWSSALLLDVNENRLAGAVDISFIEPYPDTLRRLTRPGDLDDRLREAPLQSIPLALFDSLRSGDILFIDSTHVVRAGSDVNFLFFEVLPRLETGVYVHIHDVFYPFEYPIDWLREGRSWNEDYLLRGFLQYNSAFEIVLFSTYIQQVYPEFFAKNMPNCGLNPGGCIWLRRRGDSNIHSES
jgi:hypothetical protein